MLLKQGDSRLVGTKFTWLVNEEKVSEVFFVQFEGFRNSVLFYCGGLDMRP